jgi:hypothetical protein
VFTRNLEAKTEYVERDIPDSFGTLARVVYCDMIERNRVAMSRHRHNVASRHYDGSRHCCYSGVI